MNEKVGDVYKILICVLVIVVLCVFVVVYLYILLCLLICVLRIVRILEMILILFGIGINGWLFLYYEKVGLGFFSVLYCNVMWFFLFIIRFCNGYKKYGFVEIE